MNRQISSSVDPHTSTRFNGDHDSIFFETNVQLIYFLASPSKNSHRVHLRRIVAQILMPLFDLFVCREGHRTLCIVEVARIFGNFFGYIKVLLYELFLGAPGTTCVTIPFTSTFIYRKRGSLLVVEGTTRIQLVLNLFLEMNELIVQHVYSPLLLQNCWAGAQRLLFATTIVTLNASPGL